ncbi:hypothetical protein [Streptosporangium sp. NPDC023615]|uniref:hypothetical protein n=1 Tax=Streptosporangium sp. NPDC023615 TaxID=3154794 RepID=UPI0034341B9C
MAVVPLVVRRPADEGTAFVPPRRDGSRAAGASTTFVLVTNRGATTPRWPAPDPR